MLPARTAQVHGAEAVAELLHLPAPRRLQPIQEYANLRAAAEAVQKYLQQLPEGPKRKQLPSWSQLQRAKRHDLTRALQVRNKAPFAKGKSRAVCETTLRQSKPSGAPMRRHACNEQMCCKPTDSPTWRLSPLQHIGSLHPFTQQTWQG